MIHILFRSLENRPAECLGAVVDPIALRELQHDGDAMPVGGYMTPALDHVIDSATGEVVANVEGMFRRVQVFDRSAWEARRAAADAFIAGLSTEERAAVGVPDDHVSEADRKAQRAADREAAAAKLVADQAKGQPPK